VYHALFFGTMVAVLARRYGVALALMALTSMSHPFTGVQLLGVVGAWAFLEIAVVRHVVRPPMWLLAATVLLTVGHVAYYLVYLKSFPEHRQLELQWKLPWVLPLPSLILAYAIVGALALWRFRTRQSARVTFSEPRNRLALACVGVSVLLENHELFIQPIQPIHFTRGYTWTALFLLGLPALRELLNHAMTLRSRTVRIPVVAGLVAFLLVDNAVWLVATSALALRIQLGRGLAADKLHLGYGLTREQRELFAWMGEPSRRGDVVLSEDDSVGYLLTVYTPLRSWRSHYANTPWSAQRQAELKDFFAHGTVIRAWSQFRLLVVFRASSPWQERVLGFGDVDPQPAFSNADYVAVRVNTRSAASSEERGADPVAQRP
jgi:hypothetical protein